MEKKELPDHLNELLNIPQIERIIHHKLEELKLYFEDEILFYQKLKSEFKKNTYGNMKVLEGTDAQTESVQTYYFQLNRQGDADWRVSEIEPDLLPGTLLEEILPRQLLRMPAQSEVNPSEIVRTANLITTEVKNTSYDLNYVKYSDTHVFGTVTVKAAQTEDGEDLREETVEDGVIPLLPALAARDDEVNQLLYYMKAYPQIRIFFLAELNMRIIPMIEGGMIDFSVSSPSGG